MAAGRRIGAMALQACLLLCLATVSVGRVGAQEAAPRPIEVPFELFKTKHMAVTIKVNGKGPYRVIFDTGAPMTVLSNRIAREAGLNERVNQPLIPLFGAGGQVKIKALEVGDVRAENVPAVIMDHPAVAAMARAFGPIEGIVGFPFFARYRMTLDYQTTRLTFVPNGYDPPDVMQELMTKLTARQKPMPRVLAPAGLWGLVVEKDADDEDAGVRVKEVLPESAAARAGLQAGDRLLTLDGRWTDSVADCFYAVERVPAGAEARVLIRRGGKELTFTVKPRPGL